MKKNFTRAVLALHTVTLIWGALVLFQTFSVVSCGLILIALAPCVQAVIPFDSLQVPHHKVRLPLVSLVVFCGLAVMLLSAGQTSSLLWLGLLNVGAFLLDTYWAKM